jgi:hypothetical protein
MDLSMACTRFQRRGSPGGSPKNAGVFKSPICFRHYICPKMSAETNRIALAKAAEDRGFEDGAICSDTAWSSLQGQAGAPREFAGAATSLVAEGSAPY